jgi:hypothetical protein
MIQRMLVVLLLSIFWTGTATAEPLAADFARPPKDARPWVYWFWKNGNISREGITADLAAMQRAGIGGMIVMEVALSTPRGPVPFFSEPWRKLFQHAVAEADRLGLQISMNSGPGWTGSGGAWVKPEQSMQKVVFSETRIAGPQRYDAVLPQPETLCGFYRDIAVLAFPTPAGDYRIADIREKALYERGPISSQPGVRPAFPAVADYETVPQAQVIPLTRIVDLTAKMDAAGRLAWDAPAGAWTILRCGRTSTGQTNRPAPLAGLECDKLDPAALDAHFRQFTAALLADAGRHAGKSLVATHVDSWEVGAQNWTGRFRDEFQRRRGYDPLPYLPAMTGRVVESLEVSERFLWDLRQTASELLIENHGRHLQQLARQHGLWLSIEPYDMTPCDDMTFGASADVPMCEFWSNTFDTRYSVKEATSIAHVYGKPVVAAEAFTSVDRWLLHPAAIKTLGDWAFCEGVNRLVIHRYVHQPFLQIAPGLSLGPHGLHYERTQTWWEWSRPWHEYLARCQHLLRQGLSVADLLYLSPEGAPNVFQGPEPPPEGYHYDACTPEALLTRVGIRDGRLLLPDGMSYRLLVLPEASAMTPPLLRKVKELVEAGATVVGMPPRKSPSLSGHPGCDAEVQQLASALWGTGAAPANITERSVGQGRIIWGGELAPPRRKAPDARGAVAQSRWIWHREGNPAASAPVGKRYFRRVLTLPEGAGIESAQAILTADNAFELWVNGRKAGAGDNFHLLYALDVAALLRPGTNVLAVAAENTSDAPNPAGLIGGVLVRFRDGRELTVPTDREWQTATAPSPDWTTAAATTGWTAAMELGGLGMAPWGTPSLPVQRQPVYPPSSAIVAQLERLAVPPDCTADKSLRFVHRRMDETDVYFVSNGQAEAVEARCTFRATGTAPELWHPETGRTRALPQFAPTPDGRTVVPLRFEAAESYFVVFRRTTAAAGATRGLDLRQNFPLWKPIIEIGGPWTVAFDPRRGGPPEPVTFERLTDWSQHAQPGIKYYSGKATYRLNFDLPARIESSALALDLGRVQVMAAVRLNGKDLGVLWKPPFRIEITEAVRRGTNALEIDVVNLWTNRMIGDEQLPTDSDRHDNGVLKRWPQWLVEGKPSPTGRWTFATWRFWNKDSPLQESGLLGPVTLQGR